MFAFDIVYEAIIAEANICSDIHFISVENGIDRKGEHVYKWSYSIAITQGSPGK